VFTRALQLFKVLSERESDGRLQVDLLPNVLDRGVDTGELLRQVDAGALDGCYMSTAVPGLARLSPELGLFDVPFLVVSRERAFAQLDGALGLRIADQIEAGSNLKHLGYWENGFRHLTNARRPVRGPTDLAGLRIRIQANTWHERAFRLLGAEPVSMDVAELIPALIEGRVDGQENPHENTVSMGILPFTPYVTLTSHLFGIRGLYLNRGIFESLPADLQTVLMRVGRTVSLEQRLDAARRDGELGRQLVAEGADLIVPNGSELAQFRSRVQPLHAELAAAFGPDLIAALGSK
jgi:TRAP-type C4-dicarboxylate transport system substrate-binding protein